MRASAGSRLTASCGGWTSEIVLDKKYKHDIAVVVDRLVMKGELRKRLADSIETAVALADGLVEIELVDSPVPRRDAEGANQNAGPDAPRSNMTYSEKFACPVHGPSLVELEPRIFSFNSPHGACPRCTGLGSQMEIDPELVVPDPTLSIGEGAIAPWAVSASDYYDQLAQAIAERYGVDLETPWDELPEESRDFFLYGTNGDRVQVQYRNRFGRRRSYATRFEGIVPNLERRYRETDSDFSREKIEEYMTLRPCPECKGARLRPESRAVLVADTAIHDFTALSAKRALEWVRGLDLIEHDRRIARLVLREIEERLQFLDNVGVGYLSMERAASTLSGGEAQRIRLATQIGSSLVGVLYILDEPSIGLHQRDNEKLIATLVRLRDLGNTVMVVEHDEGTMRAADHLVDMGPGAGEHGGYVVAEGTADDVEQVGESLTGQFLAGTRSIEVPRRRRKASGWVRIEGATQHNLKNIDVKIPLGVFCSVTGVSGSGKSTLVNEVLYKAVANRLHRTRQRAGVHRRITGLDQLDKIISVDQSPIGRTPRSNPATYIGLFDQIRDLFSKTQEARARGYKPGRFSFNVKGGRCEVCRGDGQIKIEMHFLPDVYVPCEQCHGKRYNRETLEVRFKGKTISDVLEMPIEEALEFFAHIPKIRRRVETLNDVGLGYMRLGQPATTLSGGEAQRVKLAAELCKVATGRTIYILDEPTTGLHFADIQRLLEVLDRLVATGNSVVVIEHNLDVIKVSDQIIDLGPEGGDEGGMVIATGTPEQVARVDRSYTGGFLADMLPVRAAAPGPAGAPQWLRADTGGETRAGSASSCGRRSGAGMSATRFPGTAPGSTGSSCGGRPSSAGRSTATCWKRSGRAGWRLAGQCSSNRECGSPRPATARIRIGAGSFLNLGVMVAAAELVEIGEHCMLANGCFVTDSSHRFDDPDKPVPWQGFTFKGPTRIGDNVWCGANVVVTTGVTIGERCVIGANCVVTDRHPGVYDRRGGTSAGAENNRVSTR